MIQFPIQIRPQIQILPRIPILMLLLLLLLLLLPSLSEARRRPSPPQKHPSKALQVIHKKFKEYESQREEFKKTDLPSAAGTSAEGTSAASYRGKSGSVVIVEESYFAEMGRKAWSYYFDGHKPFFVLLADTRYAYPITVSVEERKKLGAAEDKTAESRFYFTKGKLIRWLEGKKAVPVRSERFREQAKTVLEQARSAYQNALEAKTATR